MTSPSKIVLVGPMGVGKSSVARHLGELAKLDYYDTDAMVEAHAGCSISELFATEGEARFRELEAKALATVLALHDGCVVATGGGIVLATSNRELLSTETQVVWLDADVSKLLEHIGDTSSRPLFADRNPQRVLEEILEARRDLYAEVADFHIDVSSFKSPRTVAKHILTELGAKE